MDELHGFTRVEVRSIGQLPTLDLNEGTAADRGGARATAMKCEFVNIGVIDCLVGLMQVDDSNVWWVLDRSSEKMATYDLVVGDEYVN